MGCVITVTSGKGGTGKTSLTAGLGTALAMEGHQVLCVDMDVGLRNLDISLGMSDLALMDFTDVAQARCSLMRAVVAHPELPELCLLTAPLSYPPKLTQAQVAAMMDTARSHFDYVLVDSPAGLGRGFHNAVSGVDRAILVSTCDASSLRDAQSTVQQLSELRFVHLVVNRVQPKLLRRLHTTIDAAMDSAGLPLLGIVPEDPQVLLSANRGRPLLLCSDKNAALAMRNIARRLQGESIPVMRLSRFH